jgi:2,3-bisphosphoglycerate-independent phosphoglycerate mutase
VEHAETPVFGFAHQFPLPADCLRVLDDEESDMGDKMSWPYSIEGRMVLTDSDTINIVYLRDVVDTTQFDPLFVDALAVKLAAKLSEFIRGSSGKTGELLEEYGRLTGPLARRVDANEGRRRRGLLPMNSMFVRSRGGIPSGFVYTSDVEYL